MVFITLVHFTFVNYTSVNPPKGGGGDMFISCLFFVDMMKGNEVIQEMEIHVHKAILSYRSESKIGGL